MTTPITVGAGGGIVDASGTGTLTLAGNVTMATNTLTLTGSGSGVVQGVIGVGPRWDW